MAFISLNSRVAEHRTRLVCLGETPSPRVRCRLAMFTYLLTYDEIMATGSLPAALSLPAAISSGCARLTPPCVTALLDLRCTLGALVAPRLRHRLDRHAIARAATTGAHKAVPAADLRRCVHGLAMCSAVAWHERSR